MDKKQLAEWSSQPRPDLSEAVAADIRDHVTALASREDIYGYAILPGDPSTSVEGIASLVAAYNRAGDISVGPDEPDFTYFKYSVDEWQHWERNRFPRSDSILASLNAHFAALHGEDADGDEFDELRDAYASSLLHAILEGMALAKSRGAFGPSIEFIAVWISDSEDPIMEESVRSLNSPAIVEEFISEFGDAE